MTIDLEKYSRFLEGVASDIDIPPGHYQVAVDRYEGVGRWLEQGNYPGCQGELCIYVQGSFRLGTITRPIRAGAEADYDIDLVCELPLEKEAINPQALKAIIGDRLKEHGTYKDLLDSEGRRCWTLEYAEQGGVGFHLDVLPAVPDPEGLLDTAIAITDQSDGTYRWSASDPRGYGAWFDGKNAVAHNRILLEQKVEIQRRAPGIFASIDKVPDRLVRTPLQRAIQIMKRHRDLRFDCEDQAAYRPISVIVTTLAAYLYENELDVYSALSGIVRKLHEHAALVENGNVGGPWAERGLIRRQADGGWYIGNPVNPAENFADRWHEDNHARAKAFFGWVHDLQRDLFGILGESSPDLLEKSLRRALGPAVVAKHFDLLIPPAMAVDSAPRIHIANPAKPWRDV